MGAQNIILGTMGALATAATVSKKSIQEQEEKKEQAAKEAYLKTPEGRIETAYNKLKEQMATSDAEKEAKRRLDLELLTTKRRYTKEEYRKILSKKLSGKVKAEV